MDTIAVLMMNIYAANADYVRMRRMNKMAASLYKADTRRLSDKAMDWVLAHPTITFIILFVILAMLFGLLFNVVYGMCTIESGVMRNTIHQI